MFMQSNIRHGLDRPLAGGTPTLPIQQAGRLPYRSLSDETFSK